MTHNNNNNNITDNNNNNNLNNNNNITDDNNDILSIINNNNENSKLSILLIGEILRYCWNDKYSVFAWKVSLSLVSKGVFKIVSSFANSINLVSSDLYQHLRNQLCIFKSIDSLTTSFKFLEGFVDEFNFNLLEKKQIYLPKDCSIDNIDRDKIQDPLSLLSSLTIRGPAASYVKKEKVVLQLLLSSNTSSFKHFSMISHKNTLLKNIFSFLEQCPNLESFGLGLPMSDKKNSGVNQYLKKSGSGLKSLHLCFNFKSIPTLEDGKQLNESFFGIGSDINLRNLKILQLGHKKLSGPNYDSHSFDYPINASEILFSCIRDRIDSLTTLIFHKPTGYTCQTDSSNEFLLNLNSYLINGDRNQSLTHLELPVKITRPDILSTVANKKSLRRLTILTNQMVPFSLDSNLERLELLSDPVEKDTQEASQKFFELNSTLKIKKLVIRDHIFFETLKPFLQDNLDLLCLNVALKGKTNFGLHNNPFLSIPDAKNLKKIVAKFPHIERDEVADAISRFLRFCSTSDSIQYVKYIQSDFNLEKVNSFGFKFLNRNDRSYYYTRSLPKNDPNKILISTDLKTWNGIDDQYETFKSYITKSRKLFDHLVEQCKSRPEYTASYLLKYTKNCLTTFTKDQWEQSDELLKTAHATVLAIMDQDSFARSLVEKAHMNLDFLKLTAHYIFYGLGPTARPIPLETLNQVIINDGRGITKPPLPQQQQQNNNINNNSNNSNNDSSILQI
ncbi:hypothetical protein ACTFIW_003022 [Dictyostelium discoideum]